MVRKLKMTNCHIPFEIQEDIMKRLPVKSLIRFRSVAKPWKSLIDSSKFIIDHTSHHDHPQHMLIKYNGKYVSFVESNTFPQHQFPLNVPVSVTLLVDPRIGGYDQGLVCFYSTRTDKAIIWNPTIRKLVDINVSNASPRRDYSISFGVCRETKDPKLVKITYSSYYSHHDEISSIQVLALSTRVWRTLSIKLTGILKENSQVAIDGFIYWLAYKISQRGDHPYDLIMFDLTSEEFTEIYLPDELVGRDISLSKLRESLVVLKRYHTGRPKFYGVWMMEKGISKSFTKLYDIETSTGWIINVLGFQKSGEPIIQMAGVYSPPHVYDPCSRHIYNIGINGRVLMFFVLFYMETLLLLDQ